MRKVSGVVVAFAFGSAFVLAPVRAQDFYWVEGSSGNVRYGSQSGIGPTPLLASGLSGAFGVAVFNDTVYWSEPVGQVIRKMPFVGFGPLLVLGNGADSLDSPRGIAIDGSAEKLYWSDNGRRKIQRSNLNGSGREDLVTMGLVSPGHVALDQVHGKLYWVDNGTGAKKISRSNLDGTAVEDVVTGLNQAWGLSLDITASKVYWIDTGVDKIRWASLGGPFPATPNDLITGLTNALRGMVSDVGSDALYWTDLTDQNIKRSALDGSGITALFSGLSGPQGIAFTWDSALPVMISAMTVAVHRLSADVLWRTETESDNAGWEVERREVKSEIPEVQHTAQWKAVGFVKGAGTSTSGREYRFSDVALNAGRYAYRLKQIDRNNRSTYSRETEVEVGLAPKQLAFDQNYPNPFNPTTTISFTVPVDGRATLKVFDMLGREVATLVDGEVKAGYLQQATFDASRLTSGLYFSRLEAGGKRLTRRMMLVK